MNKLVLLTISSLIALTPIILIKEYIKSENYWYLFLALLCYVVLIVLYINIFKDSELSSTYTILQIIDVLTIVFIGICYYHESISTEKAVGISVSLFAIYLLL